MMPPTLLFALNRSQADQLCRWCASYRAYAWQHLEPTPERNQTMKVAQAVQGRLTALQTGDAEALCLVLREDEKQVLRQLISILIQVSGAEAASEERNRALGELASLRMLIERADGSSHIIPGDRKEPNPPMAEITITLLLAREQRLQFFAHLITYLFCRTLPSFIPSPEIAIDMVQIVGSRLLHLCMDERETVAVSLDPAERRVVYELLAALDAQYAQWPQREESVVALQHLAACRHLLQQAERQIINERRGE